jgi:hypothetical protein
MRTIAGAAVAAWLTFGGAAAHGECTPLRSDVVSLGERSARFYSDRAIDKAIEGERQRLQSIGLATAKVTKAMDCHHFPNLLGADEWQCIGQAKVCSR